MLLFKFWHCKGPNVVRNVIFVVHYVSLVLCSDRQEIRDIDQGYRCNRVLLVDQLWFNVCHVIVVCNEPRGSCIIGRRKTIVNEPYVVRNVNIIIHFGSLVPCLGRKGIRAIDSCRSVVLFEHVRFVGIVVVGVRVLHCQIVLRW